jgi:ClpP class serine protease
MTDTLKDKLGLNFDVVKTNELADLGDLTRPFNEEEKALMQGGESHRRAAQDCEHRLEEMSRCSKLVYIAISN